VILHQGVLKRDTIVVNSFQQFVRKPKDLTVHTKMYQKLYIKSKLKLQSMFFLTSNHCFLIT